MGISFSLEQILGHRQLLLYTAIQGEVDCSWLCIIKVVVKKCTF